MAKVKTSSARTAFHPRTWFLAYFFMFFLVPVFVSLTTTNYVYGFGYLTFFGSRAAFFAALALCVAFAAVAYWVSLLFSAGRHVDPTIAEGKIRGVTAAQMQVGWLMILLGLLPVLALNAGFEGERRSNLVSGLEGQLLFALSFALVVGYICVAIGLLERRRFILFLALTIMFSYLLFLLGGRGRVVWPIISIFVTYNMIRSPRIRPFRIAALLLALFVVGAMMDPLLAMYHGRSLGSVGALLNIGGLLTEVFIERRNFDSFYNFFLIYYYDDLPRSFSYLIDGPRLAFMQAYFPAVLDRGIGFPATVPGTFWMVGGYGGLAAGAVFVGLILGLFSRIYMRTQNAMWLGFQFYMFTWVLNLGLSLFDNLGKIFVVLILMIPFWALPHLAKVLSPRQATQDFGRAV